MQTAALVLLWALVVHSLALIVDPGSTTWSGMDLGFEKRWYQFVWGTYVPNAVQGQSSGSQDKAIYIDEM